MTTFDDTCREEYAALERENRRLESEILKLGRAYENTFTVRQELATVTAERDRLRDLVAQAGLLG